MPFAHKVRLLLPKEWPWQLVEGSHLLTTLAAARVRCAILTSARSLWSGRGEAVTHSIREESQHLSSLNRKAGKEQWSETLKSILFMEESKGRNTLSNRQDLESCMAKQSQVLQVKKSSKEVGGGSARVKNKMSCREQKKKKWAKLSLPFSYSSGQSKYKGDDREMSKWLGSVSTSKMLKMGLQFSQHLEPLLLKVHTDHPGASFSEDLVP